MNAIQIATEIIAENPGLTDLGVAGAMLGWFMLRYEKRSDRSDQKFDTLIAETRAIKHSQNGLQRAMLVVEINRENGDPSMKKMAKEMLARIPVERSAVLSADLQSRGQ